jgi:hypothetical protein
MRRQAYCFWIGSSATIEWGFRIGRLCVERLSQASIWWQVGKAALLQSSQVTVENDYNRESDKTVR